MEPTSLCEYEWQASIAEKYIPVLEAAGMYDSSLNAGNVYRLASEIVRDPVVSQRVDADIKPDPAWNELLGPNHCVMEDGLVVAARVLQAMTNGERDALARRIRIKFKQ